MTINLGCLLSSLAFWHSLIKDNHVIMKSLVMSCCWIFIRRQANLNYLVADGISLLNFFELINSGFFSDIPRFLELPQIPVHLPYILMLIFKKNVVFISRSWRKVLGKGLFLSRVGEFEKKHMHRKFLLALTYFYITLRPHENALLSLNLLWHDQIFWLIGLDKQNRPIIELQHEISNNVAFWLM